LTQEPAYCENLTSKPAQDIYYLFVVSVDCHWLSRLNTAVYRHMPKVNKEWSLSLLSCLRLNRVEYAVMFSE
jgi:hypothetical protein